MSKQQKSLNTLTRLMLNASFMGNPGLLSGKMGVCLFFYRYARHTGTKRYADFAGELLDEIYGEISPNIERDFGQGLAGVLWGVEYLVRQGFVKADTDAILGDMDAAIMERDVRKITDTSLETGLTGLAHYIMARCSGKSQTPVYHQYIAELHEAMSYTQCDPELTAQLRGVLRGENVEYEFEMVDKIVDGICKRRKYT